MPALRQSPRSSSLTSKPVDQSSKHIISRSNDPSNRPRVSPTKSKPSETAQTSDVKLANKKVRQYLPFASQTPFPEFLRPTVTECHDVHDQLSELHQDAVDSELGDGEMPETFPHVLDALIVAIFSQATSWSNAKRAIASVREVYGSTFAYQAIYDQGAAKLEETIRCGGLHVRKTKMIMSVLGEVKERYGDWTLDHLHNASDEDAMEELLGYKYVGVKTASVVMSWSLKRHPFTVDTHVFRITGLWGWRPANASKEDAQAHLEYRIPKDLRANLHFLLIQHGRRCPACRGGAKGARTCPIKVDRVSVVGNAEQ